ncbi:hypothetical protein CEXT_39941 [Caerostris extrusa]|uniref:Uncharacterized protein n=1 Tax=Caerostris extrusa TaxID=172846 RepID=A0AAV4SQM1_CAEEX|nr:hypothetical protein CEXT_39941 [Caerostris extrusa]
MTAKLHFIIDIEIVLNIIIMDLMALTYSSKEPQCIIKTTEKFSHLLSQNTPSHSFHFNLDFQKQYHKIHITPLPIAYTLDWRTRVLLLCSHQPTLKLEANHSRDILVASLQRRHIYSKWPCLKLNKRFRHFPGEVLGAGFPEWQRHFRSCVICQTTEMEVASGCPPSLSYETLARRDGKYDRRDEIFDGQFG